MKGNKGRKKSKVRHKVHLMEKVCQHEKVSNSVNFSKNKLQIGTNIKQKEKNLKCEIMGL